MRKSIWEWSCEYVGDKDSWQARGEMMATWLKELGLQPHHHVLDVGCGNLSTGVPLIRYLEPNHYCGLDPNGWLIEAGMDHFPDLDHKQPLFRYDSDFEVARFGREFDYVIAHSVLSHVAHWQLPQALANVREACHSSAVWLASLRLDQYNTYDRDWVYPGVSTFRRETIMAFGHFAGWHVETVPSYRERLTAVAPNDVHDWVHMTATLTAKDGNDLRLAEEERERHRREVNEFAEEQWRIRMSNEDTRMIEGM